MTGTTLGRNSILSSPTITGQIGSDHIAVLTMDDPSQPTNTMNSAFGESLDAAVEWLEQHRESYLGVILTSGKDSFFAGGDLALLRDAGSGDEARIAGALDFTKALFRRLESLGRPVVAALGGTALGGGFEIALACHHRIALARNDARFGLPEVTLGLLPGAGGVTRTVRMFGIIAALTQVLGQGRRYRPQQALELGLIDEIVDTTEQMMDRARSWILAHPDAVQPWDREGFAIPGAAVRSPELAALVRSRTRGAPIPAAIAVVSAAVEGSVLDFENASIVETRYCTTLACGKVSGNLIGAMFFDLGAVDKGISRPRGLARRTPTAVLVIGAGAVGAAIAHAVASARMPVVLLDASLASADRGKSQVRSVLDEQVQRGRRSRGEADEILARIACSADAADAPHCDLVVEAGMEDPTAERPVHRASENALVCSDTSAEVLRAGVGVHFFTPVETTPLVEIAVDENTRDCALAGAFDFVRSIGKTPIVVSGSESRSGHGALTTRILRRFLDEALSLIAEGVHPSSVEQAALQSGYARGALESMDDISLAVVRQLRESAATGAESTSDAVLDRMIDEFDRPGRAGGRGFHDYDEDGVTVGLWPGLTQHWHREDHGIPFQDMKDRLLVAQSLESIACLDEGVLRSTAEANVGSILGIGYPAWTGGVLQFVNQHEGGPSGFLRRVDELRNRYGVRFRVPDSLRGRTEPYR